MQTIMEWLLIFKYWLMKPIDKYKSYHTICCPKCYQEWHQFKKYKVGQNMLCKKCKKEEEIRNEKCSINRTQT